MSAVRQHCSASAAGIGVGTGATAYTWPATAQHAGQGTELLATIAYRTAGTITNLTARLVAGDRATDHIVILRNSATDVGGCDIAYTTTPGEFEDTTGSNSIAASDRVVVRIKSGTGGTTNNTFQSFGQVWAATGTTTTHVAASSASSAFVTGAETTWLAPGGPISVGQTTQGRGEWLVKLPAGVSNVTLKNLYVRTQSNASTNTSTVTVSGATGAGTSPSVTVPAGGGAATTEDTGNSILVNDGDLISFKTVTGASVSYTVSTLAVEVVSAAGVTFLMATRPLTASFSATSAIAFGLVATSPNAEASMQAKFGLSGAVISNLVAFITVVGNAANTLRLRANTADAGTSSALGVAMTATGWLTDTADIYLPASTDEMCFLFTRSAGTTTLTFVGVTIATQAIAISASDTGTAVDAGESIAATVSDADTGSGVDAGESVAVTLSDSDTGAAVDAGESVAAAISDAETGAAVDAGESIGAAVNDAETGAAVEAESVAAAVADSETGTATEAESAAVGVDDGDTGGGDDTETVAASVSDGDTGNADEVASILAVLTDDDSAASDDAATIAAAVSDGDLASVLDDESLTLYVTDGDSAISVEDAVVFVQRVLFLGGSVRVEHAGGTVRLRWSARGQSGSVRVVGSRLGRVTRTGEA